MTETQDLLFELGTEELPPTTLKYLSQALADGFAAGLQAAGLSYSTLQHFATPRRLAIITKDCATCQQDRKVERRGPAIQTAFDNDGNPTAAATGFARSCGTTIDQLDREKTDKGEWLSFHFREAGKTASELLPDIANHVLNHLPISRRMLWGDSKAQFIRPVRWLVFIQGKHVIPCKLMDVNADKRTCGHRFHHPDAIKINSPAEYVDKLISGRVIADFAARRENIRQQVNTEATRLGGQASMDDALLDEVTALVEWPVLISASFEEKYLHVPREILIYSMKKNQKYIPVLHQNGALMNHFITIANIESTNPDVVRDGNERVIRPRLADAMFFWKQDGRKKLEDHLDDLKSVVFQKNLGSMYDKSERVSLLAGLVATYIGSNIDLAKRAGLLSRCDLMTETVGEFAEMQGIMGRHQAHRDGEPGELALAMDEFYQPRFSGDQLPQTKTGIAISLAEKIDTLVGIFGIGMKPTGEKDPFALRRAALGILRILREHSLHIDLLVLLEQAVEQLDSKIEAGNVVNDVYDFMMNRLKGLYSNDGIPLNAFMAVAQHRPGDIADFDRRLNAVVRFQQLAEAESLTIANKRINNILRKSSAIPLPKLNPDLFQQDEEKTLNDQIDAMDEKIAPLLRNGDYETTLKTLAGLREAIDAFFDNVIVMADDKIIKANRLALMARLQHLFLHVADISHLS